MKRKMQIGYILNLDPLIDNSNEDINKTKTIHKVEKGFLRYMQTTKPR